MIPTAVQPPPHYASYIQLHPKLLRLLPQAALVQQLLYCCSTAYLPSCCSTHLRARAADGPGCTATAATVPLQYRSYHSCSTDLLLKLPLHQPALSADAPGCMYCYCAAVLLQRYTPYCTAVQIFYCPNCCSMSSSSEMVRMRQSLAGCATHSSAYLRVCGAVHQIRRYITRQYIRQYVRRYNRRYERLRSFD